MFKKILVLILACVMTFAVFGCEEANNQSGGDNSDKKEPYTQTNLPKYESQEFELCGLWAPHDITEEAFKLYKDAGFNVCSFTNHDEIPRNTDTQYFIGSNRTLEALEICKKVGLDVYIAYGASWFNLANEGEEYF